MILFNMKADDGDDDDDDDDVDAVDEGNRFLIGIVGWYCFGVFFHSSRLVYLMRKYNE